jgi:diguanylate cyclase (GGDEF)-like protein
VLEKNPQFTGILTIDPNGSLFCDSLKTGRTLDLRDRSYFKQALNTTGTTVIEPVFGRLTGSAVLQIAYPARDEAQRLQFILLASLDLTKFMKEQTGNLPTGLDFLLVDSKGMVLSRLPADTPVNEPGSSIANSDLFRFVAEDPTGTREIADADGKAHVWALARTLPVGGVSLRVVIGRSKPELVAGPNQRLAEDLGILGVISLVLFAAVWLLAEIGIRLQIARIAAMAERLGAGDLTARVTPPYPDGELGSLMRVLNGAAASLEYQRHDIENLNRKLRQSESLEALERQRLDIAINNMTQGLLLFDDAERIVICNERYLEIYGLRTDIVKPGCSFFDLVTHHKDTGSFTGDVAEYCSSVLNELALRKTKQTIMDIGGGRSVQIVSRRTDDGGWVCTHEDITERKRSDERIAHLAHYDALTELPNRVLFSERLDRALANVSHDQQLAVLYIDIDEFKSVNDSLGHPVGDELLKAVATRLRGCLKETDFVARLGGDEFAIIQTPVEQSADTIDLVNRIYEEIRKPYECIGHLLSTDASIGIAVAPTDGTDLDELLKNADLAMYGAKAEGRRTYRFFEPIMDERVKALRVLEMDIRKAIADRGFELHYQPLFSIPKNRAIGCEALLRWHHPERGMISPADFIPVAEETGLINELGEWVLATACAEAALWPNDTKIAVNVSPVQFRNQTFALKVAAALATSGLAAHRLELEITEAVLIRDDEKALDMLNQLRELGVRIALDDFGTGYSSLSYLQRFPFDKIKIDRSFIKDLGEPGESSGIVQAIVNIAAERHMTTTAEGVETEQQLKVLRELGCAEIQGYLFSPAKPATAIRRFLAGSRVGTVNAA